MMRKMRPEPPNFLPLHKELEFSFQMKFIRHRLIIGFSKLIAAQT